MLNPFFEMFFFSIGIHIFTVITQKPFAMIKKLVIPFLCYVLATGISDGVAQVGINADGSLPDNSAILDIKSSSRGFLPPRISTAQRSAMLTPALGLVIFNTDCNDLQLFNGVAWVPLGNNGMLPAPNAIVGNATPCINATGITYSIDPVSGATGYHWTVPPGVSITTGQGTTTLTVTMGSTNGYVCVAPMNDCYRGSVACKEIHLTAIPGSVTAGTHIAAPAQITWTWSAVAGATGYKWGSANDFSLAEDLGTATFTVETGLTCNTPYTRYVWAYNGCGYAPSCPLAQTTSPCAQWTCGQTITDARDGKTYNTVQIGSQCWIAQNLDFGTKINGASAQTDNGIPEKYCYNNDDQKCSVYGALYQWGELMQYSVTPGVQGLCPAGWHLPTDVEWSALATFLGGESVAGGKIKEAGTAHWQSPNTGATNSSGFTALPGGYRDLGTSFNGIGGYVNYWSSTSNGATEAWDRHLNYFSEYIARGSYAYGYGFYARCIKDTGSSTTTPTVTTGAVSGITQTTATSGGNVTSDGGATVTARGVCWSTSSNPVVSGNHTIDGSGTGTFVSALTGLTAATPYYLRAYATNSAGTSYGSQESFTTSNPAGPTPCPGVPLVTDIRDGMEYQTVLVGTQCWLLQNLNYGTQIPHSTAQTDNGIPEKYCFGDNEASCASRGGMYLWNEVMQYSTTEGVQGLCPEGWHLPTDAEWTTLTTYLGGESIAGGKLKETGTTHWSSPNTGATNESGFTALSGGIWDNFTWLFVGGSNVGYFWTSSQYGDSSVWYRSLFYSSAGVSRNTHTKVDAMSVRCIKN